MSGVECSGNGMNYMQFAALLAEEMAEDECENV
jgi:hypothetical protein